MSQIFKLLADVPRAELRLPEFRATKLEANEGTNVQLKCLVNSNPQPHSIHWRKDVRNLFKPVHPGSGRAKSKKICISR